MKNKKIVAIIGAVVLIGGCIGGVAFARYNSASDTPKEVVMTETEEVVNIDYLTYVKGLKDWTVEKGVKTDFMSGVTYDEKQILSVSANATKVDVNTVGKYDLVYTIIPKESGLFTKKVTVEVVDPTKTEEVAKVDETKEKGSKAETKADNKKEDKKVKTAEKSKTATAPKSKPSTGGSTSKPAEKPANKPASKPSKPGHSHNWVKKSVTHPAEYKTVTHPAEYRDKYIVDKPAWTETKKTPIYETRYTCKGCGAVVTENGKKEHALWHFNNDGSGHSFSSADVQVDTKVETINHPEQGHTEKILVTPAREEKILVTPERVETYYTCSCGARK